MSDWLVALICFVLIVDSWSARMTRDAVRRLEDRLNRMEVSRDGS